MKITHAVVTCFGYYPQLRACIVSLLQNTDAHVVVVTAENCPTSTADMIDWEFRQDPARAARITVINQPSQEFHYTNWINAGMETLRGTGAMVMLLDADIKMTTSAVGELDLVDEFMFVKPVGVQSRRLYSVLICSEKSFWECSGMDDRMDFSFGLPSIDLRIRLDSQSKHFVMLKPECFSWIPHGHQRELDTEKQVLIKNLDVIYENHLRFNGVPIDERTDKYVEYLTGWFGRRGISPPPPRELF